MNENFNMDLGDTKWASWAVKLVAFVVYAAGGLFATLAFTRAIDGFFPDDRVMNALAHIGAYSNLFSILLMVWAKDYWVTGRGMMGVAVVGWAVEVALLAMNTLAGFNSDWVGWWTGLSPATPVFVVALWGTLWLLHPEHKIRQQKMTFYAESQKDFQEKLRRAMRSNAVQETMNAGAQLAAEQFAEKSLGVVIDTTKSKPTVKIPNPQKVKYRDWTPEQKEAYREKKRASQMRQPTRVEVSGNGDGNHPLS